MATSGQYVENLQTLHEILQIPRAQAGILLQKYATVEQAMNQYFEDPVGSVKQQAPANQWEPADNIPYADDTTELPTMSRPPSRVDNHTANMGRSDLHAEGMPSTEDMELQRAIAMSQQDMPGQEMGVVGSEQQFGPATRQYYDTNQWAMTTVASSREVVEHPPPAKRQRLAGQPAFLRGSPETGYLAPLLNIYHSIPLARDAFLSSFLKVLSYGNDPQWWSGTSDENIKSISIEASDYGSQDRHNFFAELQCLMAFLDGTERAYGSVDALYGLRAVKECQSETQLSRLLETWVRSAKIQIPESDLVHMFTSKAIKAQEHDDPIWKDLVCLEPHVRRLEGQTLVGLLDSTIWDDDADKIDDIWIAQCAEVFTMRLYDPGNESKGLELEVPTIWYPDRYMYEYREVTRQWRREMLTIRNEINQCNIAQRRCEFAKGPNKRVIKIREVLEAASKIAVEEFEAETTSSNPPDDVVQPASLDSQVPVEAQQVQSQLQDILQRIDQKVKLLEERKQDLQQQIRSIASQLTGPSDDDETLSPRRKYFLQGVSTKPNITYLRRPRPDSDSSSPGTEDGTDPDFQWWRIAWGTDVSDAMPDVDLRKVFPLQDAGHDGQVSQPSAEQLPYSVQPVSEADVIQAAKTENNSIVLVYASEGAMSLTPSQPGPALRKFIEQDNHAFRGELVGEQDRESRRLSQDTNTTVMEDIPVDNRSTTPSNHRELTPMSMASPQRGVDGQPSPKRAKADETYHVYREDKTNDEPPPPYEEESVRPQMQEKKANKIGLLADQMLDRFDGDAEKPETDRPIHIEHARDPLR